MFVRVAAFVLLCAGSISLGTASDTQQRIKSEIVPNHGPADSVDSVAFSADGKLVVVGGYDRAVRLYDATTGLLLRTIGPTRLA